MSNGPHRAATELALSSTTPKPSSPSEPAAQAATAPAMDPEATDKAGASREKRGPLHIGITAVSPEGSALCYRELFRYASSLIGDSGHPTVTMHNLPFEQYLAAVERDDWHAIGEMLLKSAHALKQAGAEFAICPDNVMQHGLHLAEHGSPLPWMTMTEMVASAIAADGRKIVGLVGTRMVMFGSTYQTHLGLKGIKVIVPDAMDAAAIDGIIFEQLVHGQVLDESREIFAGVIKKLQDKGAEGLIAGFSESGLILSRETCVIPMYDPVGLLAHGAVARSIADC